MKEYRPVILIVLLGLLLLLLPSGDGGRETREAEYSEQEEKLAEALSRIQGVGECTVLLRAGGKEEALGALIVCQGAERSEVCLRIKEAVSAYTGLRSNRIVILKSTQGGKGK